MSDLYLAFKSGEVFPSMSNWMPRIVNQETLMHVEMLLKQNCGGKGCAYCKKSLTRAHQRKHTLSYYVSTDADWTLKVDDGKFFNDERKQWSYVEIPMISYSKCRLFLDRQVGKPLNRLGMFLVFVWPWSRSGCVVETQQPVEQPSWFCSELFAAVLRDQGYVQYFPNHPCQTAPIKLFEYSLQIPGAYQMDLHPCFAR